MYNASKIRREHVDRTAPDGRVELVDAFLLGEVEVERLDDLRARLTSQVGGRLFNFHLVCGNPKVIPFARTYARKLVTDSRRCAGHDCLSISALRYLPSYLSNRARQPPFLTR